MTVIVRLAAAALLCLAGAQAALAHHLWLEMDGPGVKLYFGEFTENLREASPGSLDRLEPKAIAVSPSGERALAVEKTANGFALSGSLDEADSVVAEDSRYPVFERKRGGATTRSIYRPAARLVPDRTARKPALDLDIVPAGGDRFEVYFKGKPLAKTKVEVIAASGWGREMQTGDDGSFTVSLPWKGTYVFEVQHADRTPGKRGEDAYDVMNFVTSLTVMQAQGLEPPAPPPPAKPH